MTKTFYKELMLGQNHGIFQFESPGMNALIRGLNVENFEEMAACNALIDQAQWELEPTVNTLITRGSPGQIEFPSDLIKPILEKLTVYWCFRSKFNLSQKR